MLKRFLARLDKMAADQPVLLAFLIFTVATLIVVPLSIPLYGTEPTTFFDNFLVEAHGFLFDLLIIGWFAVWLNKRAERRLRIRRYQEEIEDFLGWESPEAMHRLTGDIRRLNRAGFSAINLRKAFLKGGYLVEINLEDAEMQGANLSGAKLESANLRGANLEKAQFELTNLTKADLTEADLRRANLTGAYLEDAVLTRCDLAGANLSGAFLRRTQLASANLTGTSFVGALMDRCDLRGAMLDPQQLERTKTLYGTHLDPEIEEALRASHPALFESARVMETV